MTNIDESYFVRKLKSARTFLSRWKGCRGEMRELTVGHKALSILLSADDKPGNLLIDCIAPYTIKGPVRWTQSDVIVEITSQSADEETAFVVRDRDAGLEVVCGKVEVRENVKLR